MNTNISLKQLVLKFGTLFFLCCIATVSFACEIDMKVSEKSEKQNYKPGDELVVEVSIILNHRNCHVDISETKFMASGGKIIGATKWQKTNHNTYTRKLKVKVTEDDKPDLKLICKRVCDKEGGSAKLTLKKE